MTLSNTVNNVPTIDNVHATNFHAGYSKLIQSTLTPPVRLERACYPCDQQSYSFERKAANVVESTW